MLKISSNGLRLSFLSLILLVLISLTGCTDLKRDVYTNHLGQEVRLADYDGKVVLMNFVFTSCPHGGCDMLTSQFLRVQTLLKNRLGKDLFLVSISIDPKNDSTEILNEFAKKHRVDSKGWHFLSSDKGTINRIMKKHGVLWRTDPDGSRHHKAVIVLFNKLGKKVIVYNDKDYNTLELVKDIKKLLGPDKV